MPNKLSQSFGNYHIFVSEKRDNYYLNVVLFEKQKDKEYRFFLARKGTIENNRSIFTLTLYNGIGEKSATNRMQSIRYKKMSIFHYPDMRYKKMISNHKYWKKALHDYGQRRKLMFFIFMSLSPLIIFGATLSLSIYNPRYEKNFSSFTILIAGLLIYIPALILQKMGNIYLFGGFTVALLILDIILMRRKIFRHY